jgi:cytidine deaminase
MKEINKESIWVPSAQFLAAEKKFVATELKEIGSNIWGMLEVAVDARDNAYAPYSNYKVGASILTVEGRIFSGCNSESVAYSPTNHAEGTAIAKAISKGAARTDRKFIKAIAVCHEGDSGPCGECLQRIVEHTDNCLVIIVDPKGKIGRITSLRAIFPYNFNPSHLGK